MSEVSLPSRVFDWAELSYNQQFLLAAYRGNTQKIYELLENCFDESFDPNCYDDRGFTALHAASARGYEQIVLALLKSERINNNVLDNMARHPIEVAWKSQNKIIVGLLYENLPINQSRIITEPEKDAFVKMLFTSNDDIMGQCFNLEKLKEMSVKPRKAYDFL